MTVSSLAALPDLLADARAVFAGRGLACERGGRRVFQGLSFTVCAGEALVLVGRNGSGKSSLLRLMAGLSRPAQGSLTWNAGDIADDSEAHHGRLHLIGHQDAIKPALTVKENLGFWARYRGAGPCASARIADALRAFALERLAELPARYLSQGQRRRLSLCRLLASPTQLWLLDEPRAGLDRAASASLDAALARHRAAGGIAVVVLHAEDHPPEARVLDFDAAAAST